MLMVIKVVDEYYCYEDEDGWVDHLMYEEEFKGMTISEDDGIYTLSNGVVLEVHTVELYGKLNSKVAEMLIC